MLNSRYIHLHQALGLGSMWLNQQARIRPPEGSLKAEGFNEVKTSEAKTAFIKIFRLPILCQRTACQQAVGARGTFQAAQASAPALQQPEKSIHPVKNRLAQYQAVLFFQAAFDD